MPPNNKETTVTISPPQQKQQAIMSTECCMCGDIGFSSELFQCTICLFRSQHRYCSNEYPKAETDKHCNWCLINSSIDTKEKSQNSSHNSTSSNKNKSNKIKNVNTQGTGLLSSKKNKLSLRSSRSSNNLQHLLQVKTSPIKKQNSSSLERSKPSSSASPRRRLVANGRLNRIRRTKSDIEISKKSEITNTSSNNDLNNGGVITRQVVFRNKVRMYKHLDDVSG